MTTLEDVFNAYRDHTRRSAETRKSRQGLTSWSNSPMAELGNWTVYDGKRMINIPAHLRLQHVNPLLIDFHLQPIWARTHTSIELRLRLFDKLYQNLHRDRKLHESTLELSRLVIFHGDPRDGAPKEACP